MELGFGSQNWGQTFFRFTPAHRQYCTWSVYREILGVKLCYIQRHNFSLSHVTIGDKRVCFARGTILSTARLSSALDCSDFRAFRLSRECRTDGNKKAPLIYDRRRIKRGRGIRGTQVEWGERASDQDFQRAQGTDKVRDYAQHTQHLEEVPYETSTCRMRVIEGPRTAHTVTSSIQYQFASASLPGNLISHFG